MREKKTAPPLDDCTKLISKHVLDGLRWYDELKPYVETHAMLETQSGFSSEAEESIMKKLTGGMNMSNIHQTYSLVRWDPYPIYWTMNNW
jgi:hypothetical protein